MIRKIVLVVFVCTFVVVYQSSILGQVNSLDSKKLAVNDNKHGENAVLRAQSVNDKVKKVKYKLHKPVWDKPYPMTFTKLKKNYDFFRVAGEFYKGGLPVIHGASVVMSGAVMPIDPPDEKGNLKRFWLANPKVVMAGCVFCNPPTMSDLVYVYLPDKPIKIDREVLYNGILMFKILGRFFIEPGISKDGVEYVFSMELKQVLASS